MPPAIDLVAWVQKLSNRHRENNHWHAYYAIPAFIGFVVTYLFIQVQQRLFPNFHLDAGEHHIHHYTYGIILLLIFGYVSLWTDSLRIRYTCALAYGAGVAFIMDEAWMWFTLNSGPGYQDYDLIFYIAALFAAIALSPLVFRNKKDSNLPQP